MKGIKIYKLFKPSSIKGVILIEIVSYIGRVLSLGVRLSGNIIC